MQEEIRKVVESVWETMLGVRVRPVDAAADGVPMADPMRGNIEITGAWNGGLALELSAAAAEGAASIMLEVKPGELEPEEIHDVVGELTNILGGNFKALLPQPVQLGLPTVAAVRRPAEPSEHPNEVIRLIFDWEGNRFTVSLAVVVGEPRAPL